MADHTLNLGILAHVDAGKTSLTERLLFENGAIEQLGSVDSGNTQTDKSEMERRRGITIRSAVAAFNLHDLQVNLVDTPGHPDFIAEVERALSVLDGAVLVISAVEGVQAQTRILMRSLRRLSLPTLIFVNKIDRMGARYVDLLSDIRQKLSTAIVPMVTVRHLGTREANVVARSFNNEVFRSEVAEVLADQDDALLHKMVVDGVLPGAHDLNRLLQGQTLEGVVQPVFFGSAVSGAGVRELAEVLPLLLPDTAPSQTDRPCGTVFAIERLPSGEKVAYLRLFTGTVRERERVTLRRVGGSGPGEEYSARIAGLQVVGVDPSTHASPGPLTAGNIARVRGLAHARVGDQLGELAKEARRIQFSPPILESVVRPSRAGDEQAIHAALVRLAEEDPLIRTHTAGAGATSVLLYGAVQQEVIAERLRQEFGLEARFEDVRPVYFERPVGTGAALSQYSPRGPNEFWQTVGLRIDPTPRGSGSTFTCEARLGLLPHAYYRAVEDAVLATLQQGLYGWEVADCAVALTDIDCDFPMTVPGDFRDLTPIVLMAALADAGTQVFEPGYQIEVDVPTEALSPVIGFLSSAGAELGLPKETKSGWTVPGHIAARSLNDIGKALPGLTHGEGSIIYERGADRLVRGSPPTRERLDGNPLDRDEYLRYLSNRNLHAK